MLLRAISRSKPIKVLAADTIMCTNDLLHYRIFRRTVIAVCWRPPDPGGWKFDVDGSALGAPGDSGAGVMVRNTSWVAVLLFERIAKCECPNRLCCSNTLNSNYMLISSC